MLLAHKSPLLACSLVSTPAALQRDSSASFTALITSLAGLGLPGVSPRLNFISPGVPHAAEPEWRLTGEALEKTLENASIPPTGATDLQKALAETAKDLASDVAALIVSVSQFQQHLADAGTAETHLRDSYIAARNAIVQDWRYDYPDRDVANILENPKKLRQPLTAALKYPLPDAAQLQKDLTAAKGDVLALAHKLEAAQIRFGDPARSWNEGFQAWRNQLNQLTAQADRNILSLLDDLSYFQAAQKLLQQAYTALVGIMGEDGNYLSTYPDTQALAVGPYAQKQATVAITCKDIATGNQAIDTITFPAYFQQSPKWDFSAGALVSTLGGRQVGVVSGPLLPAGNSQCPPAGSTAPSGTPNPPCSLSTTAVTASSRLQFMPMAFVDFHPVNEKCPWATEGVHPLGYVCSLGLVGGFTANPNNGGATAEFFEGISLGVQRVALVLGLHNGRYQDFGEGYYPGQTLPSGVTPPVIRNWATHFAFGITYRIPIH